MRTEIRWWRRWFKEEDWRWFVFCWGYKGVSHFLFVCVSKEPHAFEIDSAFSSFFVLLPPLAPSSEAAATDADQQQSDTDEYQDDSPHRNWNHQPISTLHNVSSIRYYVITWNPTNNEIMLIIKKIKHTNSNIYCRIGVVVSILHLRKYTCIVYCHIARGEEMYVPFLGQGLGLFGQALIQWVIVNSMGSYPVLEVLRHWQSSHNHYFSWISDKSWLIFKLESTLLKIQIKIT